MTQTNHTLHLVAEHPETDTLVQVRQAQVVMQAASAIAPCENLSCVVTWSFTA